MQFLTRGIQEHAEPAVFMSFEEVENDLTEKVASLGFDLTARKRLLIDRAVIDGAESIETGI